MKVTRISSSKWSKALISLFLFSTLILCADPAAALIDLRAGYTMLNASPSALNTSLGTLPHLSKMQGLNADLIVSLPLMPVGLGLRGEFLADKQSNTVGDYTATMTRVSLLVNSRIIDTLMFFGPIASIGLTNEFKMDTAVTGGSSQSYKSTGGFNGSIGLEGGAKLIGLELGGELGYLYAPFKDFKDAAGATLNDSSGTAVAGDMSGVYFRVMVGFGF